MPHTLRILHTNDIHSHFENWPRLKRLVQKKQRLQPEETVLTVDLGDFLDRWHPLTEATDGQANITLMNEIGYDAATLGNNEGIGNSHAVLDHLYDRANFPLVLANLYDQQTQTLPDFAVPYTVIPTARVNIGIIGLTAPFPLTYRPNGWEVMDPMASLDKWLPELSEQADYIVLLSHLGIQADDEIAERYPEINLIIGSHTHHLFPKGKKVKTTQLAAAGKFGQYLGEVTVRFDEDGHVIDAKAETFLIESQPEAPEDEVQIQQWWDQGTALLAAEPLAFLPQDVPIPRLMHYALEAVATRGKTTISLLNTGLCLDGLNKGMVTKADLHRILPHPMRLIRVTLKGSDLQRLVQEIEKNRLYLKHYPIKGMGFRGRIFGEIYYYGLTYDEQKQTVYYQGQKLIHDQLYELTTVDHLMFIPFFPTIELAGQVTFLFPEFLRTIVGQGLTTHFPIT